MAYEKEHKELNQEPFRERAVGDISSDGGAEFLSLVCDPRLSSFKLCGVEIDDLISTSIHIDKDGVMDLHIKTDVLPVNLFEHYRADDAKEG